MNVGVAPGVAVEGRASVGELLCIAVISERGTAVGLVAARENEAAAGFAEADEAAGVMADDAEAAEVVGAAAAGTAWVYPVRSSTSERSVESWRACCWWA